MKKRNADMLTSSLNLEGKTVLDIGCGDGGLVRLMTRQGAKVTGLDCNDAQLSKAYATEKAGNEIYIEGVGQDLPFEDEKFDIVIIFNSLHHIPAEHMADCLKESARVLKPGGTLYVSEPMAKGPHFELNQPVDDETVVRDQAYAALQAGDFGLNEKEEIIYEHPMTYPDFASFKDRCTRIDPTRKEPFEALEDEMRRRFDTLGVKTDKGVEFAQPMRVNLFWKI